MFFSPIALLVFVGSIYSSSKIENLSIGFVDNLSEHTVNTDFIHEIARETKSTIIPLSDSLECDELLKSKNIHFCIILSIRSSRLTIDIKTDLSDSALAWGGYSVFEQAIKRSSESLVFDLLLELISQTSEISSNMNSSDALFEESLKAIESFDEMFEAMSERLDSFSIDSSSLDTIGSEVKSAEELIKRAKKEISRINNDIVSFQKEVDDIKKEMDSFKSEHGDPETIYSTLIVSLRTRTQQSSSLAESIYFSSCQATPVLPEDQCDDLQEIVLLSNLIQVDLDALAEALSVLSQTYSETKQTLNSFSKKLGDIKKKLAAFSSDIESFSDSIKVLKSEVSSISRETESLNREKEKILEDIKEGSALIQELSSGIGSLGNELVNKSEDLHSFLSEINPEEISKPIQFNFKGISEDDSVFYQNFSFMFSSIIFLISVISAVTFILNEKKSIAISRNQFVPKSSQIPLSYLISLSLLVFIQSLAVIFLFNQHFFEAAPIALASLESLAVLASVIIFYISFGIFLGCIFNKFENGMIISIALAGVFLLLSNKFIVIESLAGPFRQAVLLNPFLFGENLIRSFFINRVSFIFLRPDLVLSLMLSVLLILASAFTFWYTSKQLIN